MTVARPLTRRESLALLLAAREVARAELAKMDRAMAKRNTYGAAKAYVRSNDLLTAALAFARGVK
jgi:hypothetical protein